MQHAYKVIQIQYKANYLSNVALKANACLRLVNETL